MDNSTYDNLASRLEYLGVDTFSGELVAGKMNGATKLDIGGGIECCVEDCGESYEIHFRADDTTKGELIVPKSAFD